MQNLLVDTASHVLKLCDFGSAKVLVPGEPNISYICSRCDCVLVPGRQLPDLPLTWIPQLFGTHCSYSLKFLSIFKPSHTRVHH